MGPMFNFSSLFLSYTYATSFMLNISGRPWIFGEIRHSLKKTNSNHSNSGDLHLK